MKDRVLEYCVLNMAEFDKLTTPEIARHLKREFPKAPPMVIVSALGEWCTKYRPGIAG